MLASNSSLSSQAWGGPTDLIFMLVIRNLDEMQRRSVLMTEEVTCLLLLSLEHRVTSLPSKISLFPFYFITFRAFPDDSVVKNQPAMQEIQEMWVWSLGQEDLLDQEMATHSTILAWKIPWTEEPGGLLSTGSQRVGHDWSCIPSCLLDCKKCFGFERTHLCRKSKELCL